MQKDPLEEFIELKRQNRITEEQKILDDKRNEINGKRKLAELRQKQMLEAKSRKIKEITTFAYSPNGRAIEIMKFENLPAINPKCASNYEVNTAPPKENMTVIPKKKKKPIETKESAENEIRVDTGNTNLKKYKIHRKGDSPKANPFETITPAVGVSIIESGKAPKINMDTISQISGKPNKSAFYKIIANSSITNELPALFPNSTNISMRNPKLLDYSSSQILNDNSKSNINIENITQRSVPNQIADISTPQPPSEISGVLTERTTEIPMIRQYIDESMRSAKPQIYIPPSFRKIKRGYESQGNSPKAIENIEKKNFADIFSIINVNENYNLTRKRLAPIAKGRKNSPKTMQKSLGILPKFPRDRNSIFARHSSVSKLAPPPLGKSFGHGIYL